MQHPDDPDLRALLASRVALLAAAADAIVLASADGTILECNPAAEAVFGHPAQVLRGSPVTMLMPERFRKACLRRLAQLAAGEPATRLGTLSELMGLRADGSEFPLELSLGSWVEQDGTHFAGILRDITARKLAEEAPRRERELLALLAEAADCANTATTVREAMQGVLEPVCTWAGWQVGHAFLVREDGAMHSAGAWFSTDEQRYAAVVEASAALVLAEGGGLPGRVRADDTVVELPLTQNLDLPRLGVLLEAGLGVAYGFPIRLGSEVVGALEFFATGSPDGLAADLIDAMSSITAQVARVIERERALSAAQRQEARFRALVEHAADAVLVVDAAGVINYASGASLDLFGWTPEQVVGRSVEDLLAPGDLDRARAWRAATAATTGRSGSAEMQVRRADGSMRAVEAVANNRLDDADIGGIVVHLRDITDRRRAEQKLAYARLHDPLTGLPNRLLFEERLERARERVRRYGWSDVVLAVDLDDFGAVNERLGAAAGDLVLRKVAERLSAVVRPYDALTRPHDTLARAGNDEFLLLCENVESSTDAAAIAERVLDVLRPCLQEAGDTRALTATIGIAFVLPDDRPEASPVTDAQAALRRARRTGESPYSFFDEDLRVQSAQRSTLLADLEQAVAKNQLVLYYQPKVALDSGQIIGAEALLRWRHPERGLVPPLDFIPLAEQTGLIGPIGSWVLLEACRQAAEWHGAMPDGAPVRLCVNVSARQFGPQLATSVSGALAATGLPPTSLTLEITESVVMHDVELAIEVLTAIKALGVTVSIDDFGTGYSSLAYLKRLPIDELKIDRSFVDGLGIETEDTAITAAVTAMAHALGLHVVAEGVETALQLDRLREIGCDVAQGYYFSRPVPAADFDRMLIEHSDDPGAPGARGALCVVVADDAPETRGLAAVSLATAGFVVYEAADGQEALDVARRVQPDCLVLDVQMPQLSGFKVCEVVRADPQLASCTVLLLTTSAQPENKVRGYSLGADDYVVKPFTPRDLVARVRHAHSTRAAASAG